MFTFSQLRRCGLGLSAFLLSQTMFAAANWDYSTSAGPDQWATLDTAYQQCASGLEQSPINITNVITTKNLSTPAIHYSKSMQPWSITLDHDGIKATPPQPSSNNFLLWQNKTYQLIQFHFHQPSETSIDGKNYSAELHFVNQSADGSLAVVAILFKIGKSNSAIQAILDNVASKKSANFSIDNLLPKLTTFYNFNGSLTTPPCNESVQWLVMATPLELSQEQFNELKRKMPISNARPTQPLHGRNVVKYLSQKDQSVI